jgi:hypothetical protein
MRKNKFIKLLNKPEKDRPMLDVTVGAGELAAEMLTNEAVLEAVPIVSFAVNALKAKDSVVDAIYANKLVRFVNGIGELTKEDIQLAREKFLRDDGKKAGETLLLVIDRLTDLDKPELLGFLFKQFIMGHITSEQMRRLSVAVDVAFGDDLRDLLDPESKLSNEQMQDCRRRLAPTGLTFLFVASGFGVGGESSYHFTVLGKVFYQLVNGEAPNDELPFEGRRVQG